MLILAGLIPRHDVMTVTYHAPKKQTDLVRDEIEELLTSLSGAVGFCHLVREPLTGVKWRGATGTVSCRPWYLLPLVVCEGISGHYEQAIPAAAAMRLFMAAGEVFDDIEDADSSRSLLAKYGPAIATNVATVLLILAERAIARLKDRGIVERVVVHIMDAVNSFYTTACAGQHLDLSNTSDMTVSEETYLRATAMKSASTIECACHMGALLATEDQALINSFTLFGHHLGMASQIANDIQGITRGSDIVKQRITLPIVYGLAHTGGEAHNQLELAFSKQCESVPAPTQVRALLFQSGAIHYAMIKMELYKQLALDILLSLEKDGANVERLQLFLE